jgi:hypothetical protein
MSSKVTVIPGTLFFIRSTVPIYDTPGPCWENKWNAKFDSALIYLGQTETNDEYVEMKMLTSGGIGWINSEQLERERRDK